MPPDNHPPSLIDAASHLTPGISKISTSLHLRAKTLLVFDITRESRSPKHRVPNSELDDFSF